MSLQWKTPGVQVEEVSTLPTTIVRSSVTVPLFIGYTFAHHSSFGYNMGQTVPTKAVRIGSYPEYVQKFGAQEFVVTLEETLDTENKVTSHVITLHHHQMLHSIRHYFENGGGPCMVISCASLGYQRRGFLYSSALREAESVYGCELLVMPDLHLVPIDEYAAVVREALAHANTVGNRFQVLDMPDTGNPTADASLFRSKVQGENLRNGAVYYPHLITAFKADLGTNMIYIFHTTTKNNIQTGGRLNWVKVSEMNLGTDKAYYDEIIAKLNAFQGNIKLPPSAAVAGQIVRNDRDRGLWKAPANISLNAIVGPKTQLTQSELEDFNVNTDLGKSINVIRNFQGRGTMIWGARTLEGNSLDWRYIPVRRLFMMAEAAIKRGSEWAVFEPNDSNTWLRLKSMIEIYLTSLWREGALLGGKPQEAFFVRVGLGVTMTPQDILEGILRIEVGMAAVRPAEFIVLRVSQMMQQS